MSSTSSQDAKDIAPAGENSKPSGSTSENGVSEKETSEEPPAKKTKISSEMVRIFKIFSC